MSIDKSYLELALANIQDGQSKDEIVSLVDEALKQAAIDVNEIEVSVDGIVTIPQSTNPMVDFLGAVKKVLTFSSSKQGVELAKDYLKEMLNFAECQSVDNSVIENLNEFIAILD